jgi:hypothetical protein
MRSVTGRLVATDPPSVLSASYSSCASGGPGKRHSSGIPNNCYSQPRARLLSNYRMKLTRLGHRF